jgi:hypothetical protein
MAVVEPIGAAWQELHAELGESCIHATPRDGIWEAKIKEGRPVVRVLIRDRWWELRLKSADGAAGRRAAYDKIESGAAAGELFIYRVPTDNRQPRNRSDGYPNTPCEIMCRMVAWLPRERVGDVKGLHGEPPERACRLDMRTDLEKTSIWNLREAIRANRVSFPSQVPTFLQHDRPDIQRKLAQLYFVLGWNCDTIGERYGLVPSRVRQILNTWKRRAVKTGYIQHIPPVEVISQLAMLSAPLHLTLTALPDLVPQFVYSPSSNAIRELKSTKTTVHLGRTGASWLDITPMIPTPVRLRLEVL